MDWVLKPQITLVGNMAFVCQNVTSDHTSVPDE